MRKTGIDVVGDVRWGTHMCQFYQRKEDLSDILVPYFTAGLANNESCMWVTSEALGAEDARAALAKVVANLDDYVYDGQLHILDASQWYTKSGKFEPHRVLQGWVDKEKEAVNRGFDGLRCAGDTPWLEKRDRREFVDYEAEIDNVIVNYRMIAVCCYSLDMCQAPDLIDVVDNHPFALIRREGEWAVIESGQRRRVEKELRIRDKAIASSINAIAFCDLEGTLTYVNSSFLKLWGYDDQKQVLGRPVTEFWKSEKEALAVLEAVRERHGWIGELAASRKDRSTFDVYLAATMVEDESGAPICFMVDFVDITERKEAHDKLEGLYEKERKLRRQLEEEMKKRIEFTRALAHELKTPLTPVVMSSELLTTELKDETLLRVARNIHRGASNLNSRIDELLDLARGEMGMLQLKPESVDVLQLLREVVEDVAPVPRSRGQSLVSKLPPSLPLVWADRVRLRQIVLNLLNNAFKFTPEGGRITLGARQDDANLVVEVRDTGPGIAEEEQQRLFEPYHRVDTDRERFSGLGLGLALCKTLVELHGGRIWVKSHAGRGATFGFSLPLEGSSK